MPFEIVCGNITKMSVDVIVNAANSVLAPGGVCEKVMPKVKPGTNAAKILEYFGGAKG